MKKLITSTTIQEIYELLIAFDDREGEVMIEKRIQYSNNNR